MDIYVLESFISFCDDMMIVNEGVTFPNEILPRLSKNPDLIDSYEKEYENFFNKFSNIPIGQGKVTKSIRDNTGRLLITKHAFDMHSQMSLSNLSREETYGSKGKEPIVSYYSSNKMLKGVVKALLKSNKNRILNFLYSRESTFQIDGTFREFVGYGFYNDEKYQFKCARVVLEKDFYTGEIFVKTTYPIPYIGYNKRDLEKEGALDVPTVMKLE